MTLIRTHVHAHTCSRMRVALEYSKISPFGALYGVNLEVTISTYDAARHGVVRDAIGAKGPRERLRSNTLIHKQSPNGLGRAEDSAMMRDEVPYST